MKTKKYILFLCGIIFILAVDSCKKSFLQIPVKGALGESELANEAGVQGLLIGAYADLYGALPTTGAAWENAPDNWIWGNIAGGEAHKGSFGGDQPAINSIETWSINSSNGFLNDRWNALYDGVTRANAVLGMLNKVQDISDADRINIAGQARFLRGYYYFELKQMFNMVPWIEENTTDFNQPNNTDIWPKIEADFKFAYDSLPSVQSQVGRVNKWAAGAFLGKTYLFEKKYKQAESVFDDVIANGETSNGLKYGLTPNYEDNFNPATKNNEESVFAVQMTANNGTGSIANSNEGGMLNFPGGDAPFRRTGGFDQPSLELANSYRTDANGLPLLGGTYTNPEYDQPQFALKTDLGIPSSAPFTPDLGNLDPRLDWTIGRRGIPYLDWGLYPGADWVLTPSEYGPYGPKKNVYWQATQGTYADQSSWAPGTAINVLIMRYAQVLLMAAEVEANLGNLDKAEEYVNIVRNRAANPAGWVYQYKDPSNPMGGFSSVPAAHYVISPYPSGYFDEVGQAKSLSAIYLEEKLELGMEGHRFFNLSRWGIAAEVLNGYFSYEGSFLTSVAGAHFTQGKNEYFPIPLAQIDLSKNGSTFLLKQNPGYQ